MHCGSELVSFVVRHGIFHGRVTSPVGRNATICSERYKLSIVDLTSRKVSYEFVVSWFVSKLNTEILESAVSALELIFIREDYLSLPGHF